MPKRQSSAEKHDELLRVVIIHDGDICLLCHQTPVIDKTLDHVNNKKTDDRIENLILLCRSCNSKEGNRHRATKKGKKSGRFITPQNVDKFRLDAKKKLLDLRINISHSMTSDSYVPVDNRAWGSTEEAANKKMEPPYRLWVFNWVDNAGYIEREVAIDGGAEWLDIELGRGSQQSVERYFKKIISVTGWLEEFRTEHNTIAWRFRNGYDTVKLRMKLARRVNPSEHPALYPRAIA